MFRAWHQRTSIVMKSLHSLSVEESGTPAHAQRYGKGKRLNDAKDYVEFESQFSMS